MTRNVRMYNPTHRYDTTGESGPSDTPIVQWSYDLDTPLYEVAVWDGQVYATGDDGSITAFSVDGDPKWRFKADEAVCSSPAVVNGTVYVGSNDRHIYAIDATGGTHHWCFETDGKVHSSPAVVNGTVYVGSDATDVTGGPWEGGSVYALDAGSGTQQWCRTNGGVASSPAVVNSTICVGMHGSPPEYTEDGLILRLGMDGSDWSSPLSIPTPAPVRSSPTVVDGTVYVGCDDGRVYALSSQFSDSTQVRPSEQWQFETHSVWSSPAVVNNTVYVGSADGHIYALDAVSGTERWCFETDHPVNSSPAVVDGTVYIGSGDGHVYALDTALGSEQWRFKTDGAVYSSPVVRGGTIYVAGDSTLYALENSNTGRDDTEIFSTCSTCHAELNDYDDPAFCPECGADLSDSGGDTEIYDSEYTF